MLLGGCEYEDYIRWRFFECLQEGVERCCRQHVYLIDDKHTVSALRGRDLHLLDELAYVIHAIV